jgi:uncharacterized protein (DUF3084 family)
MKEKLSSFRKFSSIHEKAKAEKASAKAQQKLISITEDFHDAQTKLQTLQKEYIQTEKENKSERERLKAEIIEQTRIVKEKSKAFNRALGEQEIIDLEI